MDFGPQAGNFAKGLADAVRGTALGLRINVLDGVQPSSADEISGAELTEYAITMISELDRTVVALASYVDQLATRLRELEQS
jgi:hypothetical protein